MRLLESKRAGISTVVSLILAMLLISAVSVGLMLVLQEQGHSAATGVNSQQQALYRTREQLDVTLESASQGQLNIEAKNVGSVSADVTELLVTTTDNSLSVVLEKLSAFTGRDTGDDLCAVIHRELRVLRAEAAGDALDEDLGVGFDETGHGEIRSCVVVSFGFLEGESKRACPVCGPAPFLPQ